MAKMKNSVGPIWRWLPATALAATLLWSGGTVRGQSFDFDALQKKVKDYTVIIEMKIEVSFGIHTNEQEERYLGTIVTDDGLVIFNGGALASDAVYSSFAGFTVKTTPVDIDVTTLDGKRYLADYIGVDRFTRVGFIKLIADPSEKFTPIKFSKQRDFRVGRWVALYMLLPDFISPPLTADVGMISTVVQSPEYFPLTVGFNPLQITSVLFNETLEPVGVLGLLNDPSSATLDASGMLDSFDQFGIPLLGIVTADRLEKLIADPPEKGKTDRGWLGISLQALTEDMAQFWDLDIAGGIIVNDVVDNSPADQAGLEVGDIIYQVNGQPVDVDKEEKIPVFQRAIAEMGPDASVEFSVIRLNGKEADSLQLLATLQPAPMAATDAPEYENDALEFKVRDLVFADYLFYNMDSESLSGVVVSELRQGGLADLEGLQIGDVIQRIGDTEIGSVEDVGPVMDRMESEERAEVIFFIWRENKTLFVNIKTDWK